MDENNQEHQQSEQKQRRSTIDRFNDSVDFARKFRNLRNVRNISQTLQRVRSVATVARAAPLVANPWFWIVVAIIIVILLLIFVLVSISLNDEYYFTQPDLAPNPETPTTNANPIPGLSLQMSAGAQVHNGEEILYTITAIYGGNLDVTLYNKFPPNTEFRDASGVKKVDNTLGIVSWRLAENEPVDRIEFDNKEVYKFTLKIKPLQDDVFIENHVYASAPGGTTGPAPETNDFEQLMAGQGRNTQVLSDEETFINTLFTNAGYRLEGRGGRPVYEQYFRQLYKTAVAGKVNPAIVYSIWGVEQGHNLVDGWEFGCLLDSMKGFDKQVQCSVNTLNNFMNQFEEIKNRDGLPIPLTNVETCYFHDPFIYAYEAYTPICTMDHGNDPARRNFVIYYKELLYGKQ